MASEAWCESRALDLADALVFTQEAPLLSLCRSGDEVGDSMTSEVIEDEKQFYSKAKMYWKEVPPTVDGMLGGYGHISSIDLGSSRKFLQRFLRVGGSGCPPGGQGRPAPRLPRPRGALRLLVTVYHPRLGQRAGGGARTVDWASRSPGGNWP